MPNVNSNSIFVKPMLGGYFVSEITENGLKIITISIDIMDAKRYTAREVVNEIYLSMSDKQIKKMVDAHKNNQWNHFGTLFDGFKVLELSDPIIHNSKDAEEFLDSIGMTHVYKSYKKEEPDLGTADLIDVTLGSE